MCQVVPRIWSKRQKSEKILSQDGLFYGVRNPPTMLQQLWDPSKILGFFGQGEKVEECVLLCYFGHCLPEVLQTFWLPFKNESMPQVIPKLKDGQKIQSNVIWLYQVGALEWCTRTAWSQGSYFLYLIAAASTSLNVLKKKPRKTAF